MIRNVRCPTCGKSTPDSSFCEFCGKALYSCKACGTTIAKEALFCPDCGKAVTQEGREMKARERVSWAWWLLPLLPLVMVAMSAYDGNLLWGGLLAASLGGVIAWAANRRRDPEKARSMLWLGLSLFIILGLVSVINTITNFGTEAPPVGGNSTEASPADGGDSAARSIQAAIPPKQR